MSKELSSEQENLVLEEWNRNPENPPSLYDLTKIIFPKLEKVDGRCKEGRMIKEFLAKHGLKARPSNEYKPKDKIELTEEHQSFCRNNGSMMSFVEIARIIFDNPDLNNLSQESRAVKEYIDSLGDQIVPFEDTLPQRLHDYEPPKPSKTLAKALKNTPRLPCQKIWTRLQLKQKKRNRCSYELFSKLIGSYTKLILTRTKWLGSYLRVALLGTPTIKAT